MSNNIFQLILSGTLFSVEIVCLIYLSLIINTTRNAEEAKRISIAFIVIGLLTLFILSATLYSSTNYLIEVLN